MLLVWTNFLLLAALIAVAGYWLSRFGDIIAERTGLSGSWIGLALLATVTSMPELVTGVSSIAILKAPNLAVGNVLGSCLFNLLNLAAVDLFYRRACMFSAASPGHGLSAGYGALLFGVVGLSLLAAPTLDGAWPLTTGLSTLVIFLVYPLALKTIFTYERRRLMEPAEPTAARNPNITLKQALAGYAIGAACVIAAGLMLPRAAIELADAMGWTRTFVGTFFMAWATALPELVVTISAVRIGALDMALANLLGSNLFNLLILGLEDVLYTDGPLLSAVSETHALSVLSVLAMNGVITAGLIYRPNGRLFRMVSWVSLGLIAVYAANAWLLYKSQS